MNSTRLTTLICVALATTLQSVFSSVEEAPKPKNLENLLFVETPAGWEWFTVDAQRLPRGQKSYACKKEGSNHAISVQFWDQSYTKEDDIKDLAAGNRRGVINTLKKAGRKVELSENKRIKVPLEPTWKCSGTIEVEGQDFYTSYYVFCVPKIVVISCISPDKNVLAQLEKTIEQAKTKQGGEQISEDKGQPEKKK